MRRSTASWLSPTWRAWTPVMTPSLRRSSSSSTFDRTDARPKRFHLADLVHEHPRSARVRVHKSRKVSDLSHRPILAVAGEQLVVTAPLDDPARFHDEDDVGV